MNRKVTLRDVAKKRGFYSLLSIIDDNPGIDIDHILEYFNKNDRIHIVVLINDMVEIGLIAYETGNPVNVPGPYGPIEYRPKMYRLPEKGKKAFEYLNDQLKKIDENWED